MHAEEDCISIGELQHYVFCPRQWALITLEGQWADNRLSAEGSAMHERADATAVEVRDGVRIARALRLCSRGYGLVGRADVVEFHPSDEGIALEGAKGRWEVHPVEYKRGRPKRDNCDKVQLCAQAICLEEMLGCTVRAGSLFYGTSRRRLEVPIDDGLRAEAIGLIGRVREARSLGRTPHAEYSKKCDSCSLLERCMPRVTGGDAGQVQRYIQRALAGEDHA
jgi:CRISPR-associated exonuclease Cas4